MRDRVVHARGPIGPIEIPRLVRIGHNRGACDDTEIWRIFVRQPSVIGSEKLFLIEIVSLSLNNNHCICIYFKESMCLYYDNNLLTSLSF